LTSNPSLFTPGKEPQYQLNIGLDGPQNWSGHFGEEKNFLAAF